MEQVHCGIWKIGLLQQTNMITEQAINELLLDLVKYCVLRADVAGGNSSCFSNAIDSPLRCPNGGVVQIDYERFH